MELVIQKLIILSLEIVNCGTGVVAILSNGKYCGFAFKIDNTSGMVVPGYPQRLGAPSRAYKIQYTARISETWNGSNWINAAGEVESIAPDDVEQLAYVSQSIPD